MVIALVLGPNDSGKSLFAEKLAARLSYGALYYIATMTPFGDEGLARVEKHRKQRESLGFITVEKPFRVSEVFLPADAAILLEDVSNLLGNALFDGEREAGEDGVFADIAAMCANCRAAVLVSIDGLDVSKDYDAETCGYISALNRLNRRLSGFADTVVVMSGGTAVYVKGEKYALA